MDNATLITIVAVAAVLALALVGWALWRQRRTKKLHERFGHEYDRAVAETGNRSEAEKELVEREKRVEKYELHPLRPAERERFAAEWRAVQARFVDEPSAAVSDAHRLVTQAMSARGYPIDDIARREEDLSVEHGEVLESYRRARAIAERNKRGEATTEELRQAIVHYRTLFDALLGATERAPEPEHAEVTR